jgi:membrane protease YdiL (CAAX protease family)
MTLDSETQVQLFVLLPAAAVAIGILYQRGHLSKKALDNRPIHATGLTAIDLVVGLMLQILCMATIPQILLKLGMDQKEPLQGALLQLLMQVGTFTPLILFVVFRIRQAEHTLSDFGLTLHKQTHWLTGLWATLLSIPILMGLNTLIVLATHLFGYQTPEIAHEMLQTIHDTKSVTPLVLLLSSAIIVAPLCEEFIFRGFMLQCLRDVFTEHTPWVNIVASSFIFAGIHLGVAQWQTMPSLFLLGAILGWMYEKSGSLWPCIILHACFNALNIGIVLLLM